MKSFWQIITLHNNKKASNRKKQLIGADNKVLSLPERYLLSKTAELQNFQHTRHKQHSEGKFFQGHLQIPS